MSEREPITHELKTEPQYFEASLRGDKPYEIRRNDRGFQVGDFLRLLEYDRQSQVYSGREMTVCVTHILSAAPYLPDGYVALGVRPVRQGDTNHDLLTPTELESIRRDWAPGTTYTVCADELEEAARDIRALLSHVDAQQAELDARRELMRGGDIAQALLRGEVERLRREREVLAAAVRAREEARRAAISPYRPSSEPVSETLRLERLHSEACKRDEAAHQKALALLDGEKGGGGE